MLNDKIVFSLPLEDKKNILSLRRLFFTIYSESYCTLSISNSETDINPELVAEKSRPVKKLLKIRNFGRYGIYFRPGIREITVEYLFPNEDMEFE